MGKSVCEAFSNSPPSLRWAGIPVVILSLSLPSLCGPSIICCAEAIQSALSSSSGGIALYVGIDLVYPQEERSSMSSYAALLDP